MATLHNDTFQCLNQRLNQRLKKQHLNNAFSQIQRIVILFFILSLLVACENVTKNEAKNISASWDNVTSTLSVSGTSEKTQQYIEIHDSADGRFLGAAIVKEDGSWAASATISACAVHIELPTGTAVVDVNNAPEDCTARKTIGARSITARDIPVNIKVVNNPVAKDTIPNAVILEPAQDVSIFTGASVNFRGIAVGAGVKAPFGYRWNFAGSAPNSTIQNPGSIQFNIPGVYFIQLSVSDNLGIPDPTPATRTITVSDPNATAAATPTPIIVAPPTVDNAISINVGESLFFSGIATNDAGTVDFMYEWDFSNAVPNQFGQTPGAIAFNQAGVYLVNLFATDAQGVRSPVPATIMVTVNANGANQAPSGMIIDPPADVVINIGDTLTFTALGNDPDMTTPLYYSWDFEGAATDINMSPEASAGAITFTNPGIYNISMAVTDALGETDANPPVRVVTVLDATLPPPANGEIITQITSPPKRLKISPGDSVFFTAEVIGDNANSASQYLWDFGGGAVNSTLKSPGNVSFSIPGKYNVVFYAMDAAGNIIGSPDMTVIKVRDPARLEAEIESPSTRMTIETGVPVLLVGEIEHLNIGAVVNSFEWRIQAHGSTDNLFISTEFAPGEFTFVTAGEYHVYFKIEGAEASGATFIKTDEVIIHVIEATTATDPTTPGQNPQPVIAGQAIISPIANMIIPVGGTVNFQANTVTATNVSYNWDFSGVTAPSNLQNPAPVLFSMAGDFLVTLRISGMDNTGVAIDIFDQRLITVIQANQPAQPLPPTGVRGISTPPADMVINVGDTVNFRASEIPASSVTYQWDFAGNAAASNATFPPPVQFNTAGSFLVSVKITGFHATLAPINIFDQRVITVIPPATTQPSPAPTPTTNGTMPEGYIIAPADAFITVRTGQSITFAGAGFDPLGMGPLTFQWSFGGSLTNIETQNPGNISFNQVGTHVVTLLVKNALGQFDPTPATVVVTVTP